MTQHGKTKQASSLSLRRFLNLLLIVAMSTLGLCFLILLVTSGYHTLQQVKHQEAVQSAKAVQILIQSSQNTYQTIIKEYASHPVITEAVLHPETDLDQADALLKSVPLLNRYPVSLVDSNGNTIYSSLNTLLFDYQADESIIDSFLNPSSDFLHHINEFEGVYYWRLI